MKPSWITISPTIGQNNDSLSVTATANSGNARTGIVTVSGGVTKTFDVSQKNGEIILVVTDVSFDEFDATITPKPYKGPIKKGEAFYFDITPKYSGEFVDFGIAYTYDHNILSVESDSDDTLVMIEEDKVVIMNLQQVSRHSTHRVKIYVDSPTIAYCYYTFNIL